MATPYPNLDEELRKSTDAQRSFSAANPVRPSGPVTAARATPYQNLEGKAGGSVEEDFLKSTGYRGPGSPAGPQGAPAGYKSLGVDPAMLKLAEQQAPTRTPSPAPVIAASSQATRPTAPPSTTRITDRQQDTYGPGQANGPGMSVSVPQATLDQMGQQPLPPVEQAMQKMDPNDPFGGVGEKAYRAGLQQQLDQYRARENEGQLFKMQAMQNHLSEVQARTNKEKAEEEQRFANFAAKNGADMVLRGGTKSQKRAILDHQANAAGAAAVARDAHMKTLGAFPTAGADPVKNAILGGELANRRAITDQEGMKTLASVGVMSAKMRGEQAASAGEAEKLKQAKSFTALSSVLSDPKSSSKNKSEAQKSMLAMLGKNQTSGRMVPFKVPPEVDANGNPIGEPEDAFFFIGEDGSREVLRASDLFSKKEKK